MIEVHEPVFPSTHQVPERRPLHGVAELVHAGVEGRRREDGRGERVRDLRRGVEDETLAGRVDERQEKPDGDDLRLHARPALIRSVADHREEEGLPLVVEGRREMRNGDDAVVGAVPMASPAASLGIESRQGGRRGREGA